MDAIDVSAGDVPAKPPLTREQVASAIIAVAPSSPEPVPAPRWSKGQTIAFVILASLVGWGAIVALVMLLL